MTSDRVPDVMTLQWHITHRCVNRCRHCYQADEAGECATDHFQPVIQQFRQLTRARLPDNTPARGMITITGGEPLLHSGFFQLTEALGAERSWCRWAILTSGVTIDRKQARAIARFHPAYVQLSIDGDRPTHDALRGDGDYDRVANAVRHLQRAGVRTSVSFTAHQGNYKQFGRVVRACCRWGVHHVWTDRLVPHGRGSQLQSLTLEQFREYLEIIRRARRYASWYLFSPTTVTMRRALQFLVGGGKPYRCSAGDRLIALMPDGTVYPCRRMPISVGQLFPATLLNIYQSSVVLRDLRDEQRIPEDCRCCPHATSCVGGLRCLSHAVTGDTFSADPVCPQIAG